MVCVCVCVLRWLQVVSRLEAMLGISGQGAGDGGGEGRHVQGGGIAPSSCTGHAAGGGAAPPCSLPLPAMLEVPLTGGRRAALGNTHARAPSEWRHWASEGRGRGEGGRGWD